MKALIAVWVLVVAITALGQDVPKVFLTSTSAGNTWGAVRDQSQEMAKDFAKDCPDVQVTTNQQDFDYRVGLNHIEVGLFVRDNQFAVTDMFGNMLSTKEKGSIKNGIKGVCALILADWSNQAGTRQKLINGINASFQKGGVMGYAEISGDKMTVHSERASAMRFHMIMASRREISMARRAGITMYIYTNDADQSFQYDVKADKVLSPPAPQAVEASK
ncbi:MAG TPA: hypothetical protein VK302_14990 [Terriglobales bacterium]|nr:hypothetical protein [Terriglobales bacterium]